MDALHVRASAWYEENGFQIEAFQHAAAGHDIERAERLIEGEGLPLYFGGALAPVLTWLESTPATVMDAHPSLWVTYAMTALATGDTTQVEEKLLSAERALSAAGQDVELNDQARDLIGRIANTRANLAVGHHQPETILAESRRALEYLHPDNLTFRTAVTWKMGVAYEFQGDRAAAGQAYAQAIATSKASGNLYVQILATTGLGNLQLADNQLYLAAETYQRVLQLVAGLPIPVDVHVHLCLARIYYEWNDLDAALQHGQKSLQLAEPYKEQYDIAVVCQVFLARLKLAQGDVAGAAALLTEADRSARRHDFAAQIPKIVGLQVRVSLYRGDLATAADLLQNHDFPMSQARVALAQGDPGQASAVLAPLRQQVEAKGWQDERLKVMVLQALALHAHGDVDQAVQLLGETLALAEPAGFVRSFVDEGLPMAHLLYEAVSRGIMADYAGKLLAVFSNLKAPPVAQSNISKSTIPNSEMIEPLSERELEVLHLIAEGLTNPEIAARLYLSLNTVKAHTRNIYGKLGVHTRTQAVARARDLGVLSSSS